MKDTANKKPGKECKAPPMVARLLTGFFFSVLDSQEEERKSVHFLLEKWQGVCCFLLWRIYGTVIMWV